jgi:hypothetical protein
MYGGKPLMPEQMYCLGILTFRTAFLLSYN